MDEKGNTHVCEAPPALPVENEPEASVPTYLIVLRGGIPGAMLPVTLGENWIGRASDSSIQLVDPTVSRLHAVLRISPDGRATLIDRQSTNGTYINNNRLEPGQSVMLSDGDRLRVGSMVVLKYSRLDPCEEHYHRELFERSVRDHLTGLYNRAYLLDQMGTLAQNAEHSGLGLAVMMLDIDHFKRINDTYGHDAGDAVLREVSAVLRQVTRSEDLVARYGGEEFVVALPCLSIGRAVERAEKIRKRISERKIRHPSGSLGITVSIGVSFAGPERRKAPTSLISAADLNLYQAKEAGRDCVVCFTNLPAISPDGQLTTDGDLPPVAEPAAGRFAPGHPGHSALA